MEVVNTVGRRKAAVARVFVKPGNGQITINHKELAAYFPLEILQFQVKQPLLATNTVETSRARLKPLVWVSHVHCARSTPRCVRC